MRSSKTFRDDLSTGHEKKRRNVLKIDNDLAQTTFWKFLSSTFWGQKRSLCCLLDQNQRWEWWWEWFFCLLTKSEQNFQWVQKLPIIHIISCFPSHVMMGVMIGNRGVDKTHKMYTMMMMIMRCFERIRLFLRNKTSHEIKPEVILLMS